MKHSSLVTYVLYRLYKHCTYCTYRTYKHTHIHIYTCSYVNICIVYIQSFCLIKCVFDLVICPAEQKSRYETYISLLQAKQRAETDDLEKIEASVMGVLSEGRGAGAHFLRKSQSSPSISQAHGLNGRAAGRTAPGQRS